MEETKEYEMLYEQLHKALKEAAEAEFRQKELIGAGYYNEEDQYKLISLNRIAVLELREYMAQFLSQLNMELLTTELSKLIYTFADAVSLINSLKHRIIAKMESQFHPEYALIMTYIINCCMDFLAISTTFNEMSYRFPYAS